MSYARGDRVIWEGKLCLFLGWDSHWDAWILPYGDVGSHCVDASSLKPATGKTLQKEINYLATIHTDRLSGVYRPHEDDDSAPSIGRSNALAAIDQVDAYESEADAIRAYLENTMDTAKEYKVSINDAVKEYLKVLNSELLEKK